MAPDNNTTMSNTTISMGLTIKMYSTLFTGILAFILNLVLLTVLTIDPLKCLRNTSSKLIINLSISDMLTGLCVAFWSSNFIKWLPLSVSGVFSGLIWTGYTASFLTIAVLSLERYIAIRYIWSAQRIVTQDRTMLAIFGIWLVASSGFVWLKYEYRPYFMIVLSTVAEISVLIAITFYLKLWRYRRALTEHVSPDIREERRLTMVVFLITLVLVITTLPVLALYQIHFVSSLICGKHCLPLVISQLPINLLPVFTLNFSLNPIIYAWRLPHYRNSFWELCSRLGKCKMTGYAGVNMFKRKPNKNNGVMLSNVSTIVTHEPV